MTLSRWLLATSVVLLVACSSDPSVNDEPEQQGTAVSMPRQVLSQAEQAACRSACNACHPVGKRRR